MAPMEIATLVESPQGAAFEVKIKSPQAQAVMTPARARLEAYGAVPPLPCLLHSRRVGKAPVEQDRADKARLKNEHKREVAERARLEQERAASAKRAELEQELEKAAEKREGVLADRSGRAGRHFETVRAKGEACQHRQVDSAAALRQRLEEALSQKGALRAATVAERGARAGQHNEAVAEKVLQHQEQASDAKRAELEQELNKAAEKRENALADRSGRAGKHFERVRAKAEACQSRHADSTVALRQRLEETLTQKGVLRAATVAERSARAGQHNGAVAEKVLQHQEAMQRQTDEFRGKAAVERFALLGLRAYERHCVVCP